MGQTESIHYQRPAKPPVTDPAVRYTPPLAHEQAIKTKQPWNEIRLVTPVLAEELLRGNTGNRVIRKQRVAMWSRIIRDNRWMLNNDTLVMTSDGRLLNGQHRLLAIVDSGIAVPMQILWNADPRSYDTMDRGVKRSVADALRARGFTNVVALAGGLSAYNQISTDSWAQDSWLEPDQALDLIESLPGFERSFSAHKVTHGILTPAVAIGCHYHFQNLSPDHADEFMEKLGSGAGLASTDPIFRLRERVARKRGFALHRRIECAFVIKAWNAWRQGQAVKVLVWREDEPFPVPV